MRKSKNRNSAIWVALLCGFAVLTAQQPKWSLTVGGGWTLLPMSSVNNKHSADIEGFAEKGVPLEDFPGVGKTGMIAIRVQYRFSHNGALTATFSSFSQQVKTSSLDPSTDFSMTRLIGLEDYAVGIMQYLPGIIYPAEMYFELAVGTAHVIARTDAIGEVTLYTAPTVFDEVANFAADKGYAAIALGAYFPLFGPLVLNGEARFKSIPVGQMDGKLVQGGAESEDRTLTSFDFSGIYLSLGLGVEF